MSETPSDRLALAKLVRELERQLKENKDAIFKPVIASKDQVRQYFEAFASYLTQALKFSILPQRANLSNVQDAPLPVHRDNLGALAGRIGELAAALEASTIDIERELSEERAKVVRLKADLDVSSNEKSRLATRLGLLEQQSSPSRLRLLQGWIIGLGAVWAITLGFYHPDLAWLGALLEGVNATLVLLAFRA